MRRIGLEEITRLVRSYGSEVHFAGCADIANWEMDDSDLLYERCGCAVLAVEYEFNGRHNLSISIYQISPDADLYTVTEYWMNRRAEYKKQYENSSVYLFTYVVTGEDFPNEWYKYTAFKNFSRQGKAYPVDKRVRRLTAEDIDEVIALCEPSMQDDTVFGKILAEGFCTGFECYASDQDVSVYGIYESKELCGIAECRYSEALDVFALDNIFVSKNHRNKGLGKALVRTALSERADAKWAYQAGKDNDISMAFVKSLGFTLEGTSLIEGASLFAERKDIPCLT